VTSCFITALTPSPSSRARAASSPSCTMMRVPRASPPLRQLMTPPSSSARGLHRLPLLREQQTVHDLGDARPRSTSPRHHRAEPPHRCLHAGLLTSTSTTPSSTAACLAKEHT
jgi:hypothetical protein